MLRNEKVTTTAISTITDRVWAQVETWQSRPLAAIYPIVYLSAIQAIFPYTNAQRCVIHQVRHSLAYVSWKDRKTFAADLQAIYGAPTRKAAEMKLYRLSEK